MPWIDTALECFKEDRVTMLVHVPDIVLAPMIERAEADADFRVISATREEEGMAILSGAYLGGQRGALLLQNSGIGNSANILASLIVPYQIPFLLLISERGGLGEFNAAQVGMGMAMRPVLDGLGLQHFTLEREDQVGAVLRGASKLAFSTDRPVAVILSTLMTGGKKA